MKWFKTASYKELEALEVENSLLAEQVRSLVLHLAKARHKVKDLEDRLDRANKRVARLSQVHAKVPAVCKKLEDYTWAQMQKEKQEYMNEWDRRAHELHQLGLQKIPSHIEGMR
jgi:predicted nuclease with TOPRIM domain